SLFGIGSQTAEVGSAPAAACGQSWTRRQRYAGSDAASFPEICDFLRKYGLQLPVMLRLSNPPAIIEFGHFSILPHRRQLLAEGRPIRLGGRAFDLLLALIEAPGAVLGK